MLAFIAVCGAAIEEGDGEFRVELDGLVVVLDGAVVLAFGAVGEAAIDEDDRTFRVERDGLIVVLDGAIVLAFIAVGSAAIVEDVGVAGVELDGLVEVLDGAVVLAFIAVGGAAIVEGDDEVVLRYLARLDHGGAAADPKVERNTVRLGGHAPRQGLRLLRIRRIETGRCGERDGTRDRSCRDCHSSPVRGPAIVQLCASGRFRFNLDFHETIVADTRHHNGQSHMRMRWSPICGGHSRCPLGLTPLSAPLSSLLPSLATFPMQSSCPLYPPKADIRRLGCKPKFLDT